MDKTIKLSAVNAKCNRPPEEANPYSRKFDPCAQAKHVEGNVKKCLFFCMRPAETAPDLVCTFEDIKGYDPYLRYMDDLRLFESMAEEIPGPTSERIGKIAKQYGMHIAANYYEKDGDRIYNSTVLIGRDGKIIGTYRKIHLPVSEKWRVTRGDEFSVFETDIGRIGFAVCYDMAFTEHCRSVALNGADIILHPTAGMGINCVSSVGLGEALLRVRAAENAVYLVAAKNVTYGGLGNSCIVNNAGEIIGEFPGGKRGACHCRIHA